MAYIPTRMCIACRKRAEKSKLIRVVMTENGIMVDKKHNMLCRGAYICKCRECIELAKKKKALSRNFRQNVTDSVFEMLLAEVGNG